MRGRWTGLLVLALLSACGGDEETEGGETPNAANEGAAATAEAPAPPPVVSQVCLGEAHTCVMRATGEVFCAGKNLDGELGDGTAQTRWSWAPVQGVSGATQIACGDQHTCAITGSGVLCWGLNAAGQLGSGNTDAVHQAVAVPGLTGVTALALGDDFSCARNADDTVACWGDGSNGRLGNGADDASSSPVAVSGLTGAVEIAAGRAHACARKADGTVVCWGAASQGQLGQGGERPRDSYVPVPAAGIAGAFDIDVGGNHSCAVTPAGVSCWGNNRYGQSGAGEEHIMTPTVFAGFAGVTQLALGESRTCAVVAGGAVHCVGYNNYVSQLLGTGSEEEKVTTPAPVTGLTGVQRLATHARSTRAAACGINEANQLFCWGTAGSGRFGNGEPRRIQTATVIVPDINAMAAPPSVRATFPAADGQVPVRTSFQVGSHTACGVRDGQVYCFGVGSDGRLGTGGTRANPSDAAQPAAGITDAVQVSTGLTRSCALRRNGAVACWGRLTGRVESSFPLPIEGMTAGVIDVGGSADSMTVCGVNADQTVSCAGRPLGANGEATLTATPVPGLTEITNVIVGTDAACALQASGKVFCWGSGSYGQLGNGATDRTATPVEVSGIRDATDIGGGSYNFCALRRNGSVSCWGSGDDGQLTNGQTGREANSATPVAIRGLRGVARLSKMGDSMCATLRNGDGMCWGANDFGQTGHAESETDDVQAPWAYLRTDPSVEGLGGIGEMGCGWNFCCAMHMQGGISCAGSTPIGGASGFLGLSNRRSTTPIAAAGITYTVVAPPE
ncbi:MAG: RCC1 domain-containing protein [Sandaracinaceae bacterium]